MKDIKKHRLSDLYDMSSGISTTKDQAGHGSPFVSFSTVFNNYFLPDTLPNLMDTSAKEQETYSIKEGDILLTRTSEIIDELAMSCVALKDYPKATYSGFTKRLRPKTEGIAYHKYLAFYLRGYLFRKAVTNNAFMTLRASFNEDIFSFLNLYLPAYDEQVRIGDLLYNMEQKIQLNNRIIAELEEMAKTIYNYWFIQFDFPDAEGKPYCSSSGAMVWNEKLKKEIPQGWQVSELATFGEFKNGINYEKDAPQEQTVKIINVRDISSSSSVLLSETLDNISLPAREVEKYLVEKDDILIARSGIPGATRIMPSDTTNTIYCGFVIRYRVSDPIMKTYLYFSLKQIEQTSLAQSGGTILKNISQDTLKNFQTIIPDELTLASFREKVEPIFEMQFLKSKENSELNKLREWLLPLLINGQVTVDQM